MPVDFRTKRVSIPNGTGTRTINDSVSFNSSVVRVAAAINGFTLDYVSDDHHINVVQVRANIISFNDNDVNFSVTVQYADKNFDDAYRGEVVALVIAEVRQ